jgi:hypothetical protein
MIATATKRPSIGTAIAVAGKRAAAVVFASMSALGVWGLLMMFAPALEGRYYPVVKEQIVEHLPNEDGGIAFYMRFDKVRDCYALGRAWYAVLPGGVLKLVQAQYPDESGPMLSRPVGRHRGVKTVLRLEPDAVAFFGVTSHQCGMPWGATRSPIGPFYLKGWEKAPHGQPFPPEEFIPDK